MKKTQLDFIHSFFPSPLTEIDGIKFTHREIDILACLLNGRSPKGISFLLSISSRTVEAHVRNIMAKIGCNSREGIIEFIEKSPVSTFIKKHYNTLRNIDNFQKSLKKISKLERDKNSVELIVYGGNKDHKKNLIHQLTIHLKEVGLQANVWEEKENQGKNLNPNLLLTLEKEDYEKIPQELSHVEVMDLSESENYYFTFLEILKKVLLPLNLEQIIAEFKEAYEETTQLISLEEKKESSLNDSINSLLKRKKWQFVFSGALLLIFFFAGFLFFQRIESSYFSQKENSIRSDLVLPTESVFLDRPELLDQIDRQLKEQKGIKTVALVGPGGAGKTTLARQYVHQQNGLVWEINAETDESLKASFWSLAHALAKTEKDKETLREIEDIKDLAEREEKVWHFIKDGLHLHPHWALLYDNVEKLADIQKFFPGDFKTWGTGKVLVTTRNPRIQNSKLVHGTLVIEELSPQQKLTLFTKILEKGDNAIAKRTDIKEVKQFLEKIPSYPLDVSIAAYYLKTNDIAFKEYVDLIDTYNTNFAESQEGILKEVGDYLKTRYSIISLSLKQLIHLHPDYADLLLFVSLLDSQKIPQAFLHQYKNKKDVQTFIQELNKYSLLANDSSLLAPFESTLSFHRSTQAIILAYMLKTYGLEETKVRTQSIAKALEQVAAQEFEKENTSRIKVLVNHFEVFLSHDQLLSASVKSVLTFELGRMYGYLSQYEEAKELLEQSLETLQKQNTGKDDQFAQISAYLGSIYKELSNPQKAQDLLEESLAIYNKNSEENQGNIARTLTYLGDSYKNKGDLEKAKSILERSVLLYKNQTPLDHSGLARALTNLGSTQRELGNFEASKNALEESLAIYRTHSAENFMGIARVLYCLGPAYAKLGAFKKAQSALEESIELFKKYSYKNNILIGRALVHLANIYRDLGDYKKAKEILEEAFLIHKTHYSKENSEYAWALLHIGFVYGELEQYQKAKVILEQGLETYKKSFKEDNIRIAWISYRLARIHKDLNNYGIAIELLEKSLPIYEKTFGKDNTETAHVIRTLAQVYLLTGNLEMAKNYLQRALSIFQQNKHFDAYRVYEDLADLEVKKAQNEKNKGNQLQTEAYKAQAINHLTNAHEIVRAVFPADSPHLTRIQDKIIKLK